MKSMSEHTVLMQAWDQFINQWQTLAESNDFPAIEHDENWPSPCEFEYNGNNRWKPVSQKEIVSAPLTFDNVEAAIEFSLNDQFKAYFSGYFSEELIAEHDKGKLYYLQAWSESDFERLQQNLIGHLLIKKRLKQSPTLFFACTDQEDLNLVVDNETGNICLEYVGKEPHETLANSLAEFIAQTKPLLA